MVLIMIKKGHTKHVGTTASRTRLNIIGAIELGRISETITSQYETINTESIILKNAVESTTSGYCTDSLRDFDDFLLHRIDDTISAKNRQNLSKNQHINHSRYDSTAFFRIIFQKLVYQ